MGLFDFFTFKKDAKPIFSKENFVYILTLAKDKIVEQAKLQIAGEEKKIAVDYIVTQAIRNLVKNCKNKVVLWLVDRICEIIPHVTQLIYEFLKEKIENL